MKTFIELRKIDVSEHIEKKNNLSYLSWAYAVDELLQADPMATWEYKFFDYEEGKVPYCRICESCMVFCSVTAFGKTMTAQLPVMDHRNKAIQNPDAFAVNTAMQRCLAKAISLHGIGLYIYAGEDLPEQDKPEPISEETISSVLDHIETLGSAGEVRAYYPMAKASLRIVSKGPLQDRLEAACKKRIADLQVDAATKVED